MVFLQKNHINLERLIGISAHLILDGQICLCYGYVSSKYAASNLQWSYISRAIALRVCCINPQSDIQQYRLDWAHITSRLAPHGTKEPHHAPFHNNTNCNAMLDHMQAKRNLCLTLIGTHVWLPSILPLSRDELDCTPHHPQYQYFFLSKRVTSITD